MSNFWSQMFFETWFATAVRLAGPVLLVALGETISQRSGVLNLGIEGTFVAGALAAFVATSALGSPVLGLVAATLIGGLVGLVLAWMFVTVRVNQVVGGVVFNAFMIAAASYVYRTIYGGSGGVRRVSGFPALDIGPLTEIPFIGPALFGQSILLYVTVLLVFIVNWFLFGTVRGLALRSTGENARAADAAGVDVTRIRYLGVMCSGAFAGAGGAYLILTAANSYRDGITEGKGFIALAIVIFGSWKPIRVAVAALIFGAADGLQLSLQAAGLNLVPQVLFALPYLLTVVAVSGVFGRRNQPAGLMVPYSRE